MIELDSSFTGLHFYVAADGGVLLQMLLQQGTVGADTLERDWINFQAFHLADFVQ